MERDKKQNIWKIALLVAIGFCAALLVLLGRTGFFSAIRSQEALQTYIEGSAPYSHVVFFALQFASVVLAPIPSNLTAAVGGMLFGTLVSFLLTAGAVISGSVLVFQLGRTLGKPFVERFVGQTLLEKYADVIHRKRDTFLFLAFLFPFFPDDLLCIMAGLTDISFRRFFLLVLLARPWGLLVACMVGGSAYSIPAWGMVVLAIGGIALFVLGMKYGDRLEDAVLRKLKK